MVNPVVLPIETHGLRESITQDVRTNATIDYLPPGTVEGKSPNVTNDLGIISNSSSNPSGIQIRGAKIFSYDLTSASIICEIEEANSLLDRNETLERSATNYLSSITSISPSDSGNGKQYLSNSQSQSIWGQEVTTLSDLKNQALFALRTKGQFFFMCMAMGTNLQSGVAEVIESIVAKYPSRSIAIEPSSTTTTRSYIVTHPQADGLGWLRPLTGTVIVAIIAVAAFFYFSRVRKAEAVSWDELRKRYR